MGLNDGKREKWDMGKQGKTGKTNEICMNIPHHLFTSFIFICMNVKYSNHGFYD